MELGRSEDVLFYAEEMKFAWRLNRVNILEVTRRYAFNEKKVCYYGLDSFFSKT